MKTNFFAVIVFLISSVLLVSCSKNDVMNDLHVFESDSISLFSSGGPFIRIGFIIPEFRWDTPRSGCKRRFGMCDPSKGGKSETTPIIDLVSENSERDFDLTLISPSKMKMTFLYTLAQMGENNSTTHFTIDYIDDIVINQTTCSYFNVNSIVILPGNYPLFFENNKWNVILDITSN